MMTRAALGAYQKAQRGSRSIAGRPPLLPRAYGAPVATLRRRALLLRAKKPQSSPGGERQAIIVLAGIAEGAPLRLPADQAGER